MELAAVPRGSVRYWSPALTGVNSMQLPLTRALLGTRLPVRLPCAPLQYWRVGTLGAATGRL